MLQPENATMNPADIIREMRVLPKIDPQFEVERRVGFIKSTLKQSGAQRLILGISGGVDSSTCGRLAQLATDELNREQTEINYQFVAGRLP